MHQRKRFKQNQHSGKVGTDLDKELKTWFNVKLITPEIKLNQSKDDFDVDYDKNDKGIQQLYFQEGHQQIDGQYKDVDSYCMELDIDRAKTNTKNPPLNIETENTNLKRSNTEDMK